MASSLSDPGQRTGNVSVHWTNGRSALQATRPTSKASGILFLANTVLGGQVDGCGGEFDDSGSIR
ncbi:MAG: hypothetical protein R3C99_10590 [Pirellulaceae bacterium]|nr:hypothetical protein [Planctomycetales bacterium]MCA9164726.1 hypothetical protein [Planctomycetales bacterium]MCA9210532.1 hypothetical protein [Planctomycetales bacterium]MCA9222802.1 hypothetical protein [Planctomycetales bacterium]